MKTTDQIKIDAIVSAAGAKHAREIFADGFLDDIEYRELNGTSVLPGAEIPHANLMEINAAVRGENLLGDIHAHVYWQGYDAEFLNLQETDVIRYLAQLDAVGRLEHMHPGRVSQIRQFLARLEHTHPGRVSRIRWFLERIAA